MSDWISVHDKKPLSEFEVVFVTDGKLTSLARWLENPEKWYGNEFLDEDGVPLDIEWRESHWLFETEVGPFIGNLMCFGSPGDITHWMPLPNPPEENE